MHNKLNRFTVRRLPVRRDILEVAAEYSGSTDTTTVKQRNAQVAQLLRKMASSVVRLNSNTEVVGIELGDWKDGIVTMSARLHDIR